jgi:hypothetical protein
VFSAYPKVRKNKLEEAFKDRKKQGYAWNNLMLQRWIDHNGVEQRVLDCYNRNRRLIDLNYQPEDVKNIIVDTIRKSSQPKNITQVGIRLLKFCDLYDLKKISDNIQLYSEPFQAKYPEPMEA